MGARLFFGDKEIHGLKSYSLNGFGMKAEGKFDDFRMVRKLPKYHGGRTYTYIEKNSGKKGKCRPVGGTSKTCIMEIIN